MLKTSTSNQLTIGSILVLLIVATRGHHFASLTNLPGASWAAFFLAGIYLRPVAAFAGLLALTWILDFAAVRFGGVSSYCISPAYVFLLPAYGSLWLAGRWYAARHCFAWRSLGLLACAMLVGGLACELLSSGGFYLFSGRFAESSLAEFGGRLLQYFPPYLESLSFYVGVAALAHVLLAFAHGIQGPSKASNA
ncbi:MAG: hypothetical protein ACU843_09465 [Gammaproteobacteria bacterium]